MTTRSRKRWRPRQRTASKVRLPSHCSQSCRRAQSRHHWHQQFHRGPRQPRGWPVGRQCNHQPRLCHWPLRHLGRLRHQSRPRRPSRHPSQLPRQSLTPPLPHGRNLRHRGCSRWGVLGRGGASYGSGSAPLSSRRPSQAPTAAAPAAALAAPPRRRSGGQRVVLLLRDGRDRQRQLHFQSPKSRPRLQRLRKPVRQHRRHPWRLRSLLRVLADMPEDPEQRVPRACCRRPLLRKYCRQSHPPKLGGFVRSPEARQRPLRDHRWQPARTAQTATPPLPRRLHWL
mmetsp:Transcript_14800/g.40501  ORF Transcript_14800/g.40501 Transcript_14800/m.40501 type:complete len:284 (-) Transcript_14800:136-987(-)